MEAGALMLFGTIFAISPHIFPWYTTVLLPWVGFTDKTIASEKWSFESCCYRHRLVFSLCYPWWLLFLGAYQDWTWYYVVGICPGPCWAWHRCSVMEQAKEYRGKCVSNWSTLCESLDNLS